MTITTGLSVSVFNVLKYFFLIIFIETIARRAMNDIHVFLRKFNLYKGLGCRLSNSRIDRYSLLQIGGNGSFMRNVLWLLLVICLYTVEISFEFSSGAVRQLKVSSEQKLVYEASFNACAAHDLFHSSVAFRMSEMATLCVDLTENEYTLYRPVWVQEESREAEIALCVKVPQNVLGKGERAYTDRRFSEGTSSFHAVADLISALKANAWNSNDCKDRDLVVISVSNSDIFSSKNFDPRNHLLRAGLLLVRIPSRPGAYCGGVVMGAVGEGVMGLTISACVDKSITGLHYLQMRGTAPVFVDADLMETESWTVIVATYFGIAIRNFTKGVFNLESNPGPNKILGYTGLISSGFSKDAESLSKYAAVYKHCNLFNIAQGWDAKKWREVEYASVEEVITVTLSELGLAVVICWSIVLWIIAQYLLRFADRRGMPEAIEGEMDIAQRWAAKEDIKEIEEGTAQLQDSYPEGWLHRCFSSKSTQIYLNVEAGTISDDIVASRQSVHVLRDKSKRFKAVQRVDGG